MQLLSGVGRGAGASESVVVNDWNVAEAERSVFIDDSVIMLLFINKTAFLFQADRTGFLPGQVNTDCFRAKNFLRASSAALAALTESASAA